MASAVSCQAICSCSCIFLLHDAKSLEIYQTFIFVFMLENWFLHFLCEKKKIFFTLKSPVQWLTFSNDETSSTVVIFPPKSSKLGIILSLHNNMGTAVYVDKCHSRTEVVIFQLNITDMCLKHQGSLFENLCLVVLGESAKCDHLWRSQIQ